MNVCLCLFETHIFRGKTGFSYMFFERTLITSSGATEFKDLKGKSQEEKNF